VERTMEILILVDQSCADYFKRRKIFPTQEIREEKSDGSLIVCNHQFEYPPKTSIRLSPLVALFFTSFSS